MKKFLISIFICFFSIFSLPSVAQEITFYGITLGQPLPFPECSLKLSLKDTEQRHQYFNTSQQLACIEKLPPDNSYAFVFYTYDSEVASINSIYAIVDAFQNPEGQVTSIAIIFHSAQKKQALLKKLTQQYGKPTVLQQNLNPLKNTDNTALPLNHDPHSYEWKITSEIVIRLHGKPPEKKDGIYGNLEIIQTLAE